MKWRWLPDQGASPQSLRRTGNSSQECDIFKIRACVGLCDRLYKLRRASRKFNSIAPAGHSFISSMQRILISGRRTGLHSFSAGITRSNPL
ncbi:hypothetical protein ACO7_480014 [Thiomonas arsenitoxydans]|nr:hypothetical protein ACO7_480014 [Thiomonas arsenitoxydans]CQR36128.1 hypothetical protein ACO3_480014 [Thiomonas arsenitoxydans]